MRMAWTPTTLVRGAGLLDQMLHRTLPPVPLHGLPAGMAGAIHGTISASDAARARAAHVAHLERDHLLRVARAGDGVGGAVRLGPGDLRRFGETVADAWTVSDVVTGNGAQRLRRLLRGGGGGSYRAHVLAWTVRAGLRWAATRPGLLGSVGGPSAARFLRNAARSPLLRADTVRDNWAGRILTGKDSWKTLRSAGGVLRVAGGVVKVLGVATDGAAYIRDVHRAANSDGADRRGHMISAGMNFASTAAGAVLVASMFTPVGPVALGIAGAVTVANVAYQNREAIGRAASTASSFVADRARGFGQALQKLF